MVGTRLCGEGTAWHGRLAPNGTSCDLACLRGRGNARRVLTHNRVPCVLHAASTYSSKWGIVISKATATPTALKIAGADKGGLGSDSDEGSDDSECMAGPWCLVVLLS